MLLFSKSLGVISDLKEALYKEYKMSDLGELRQFLGMNIQIARGTACSPMTVSVNWEGHIIDIFNRFGLRNCKPISAPIAAHTIEPAPADFQQDLANIQVYQQMLGCIMYAMKCARLDRAFTVSHLRQFGLNPAYEHMGAMKRPYHYL